MCQDHDPVLPDFHIVIPARYASTRYPQKLLATLVDKPVIQWVFELALRAGAQSVTIATDHPHIADVARGFGAEVIMTRDGHENGTERLAEVAAQRGWRGDEIIVNVQGDEPLLPIELIQSAVRALAQDTQAAMSTVACAIQDSEDFFNPNIVKLVTDAQQRALYFSRAPIPWDRDGFALAQEQQQNRQQWLNPAMPVWRHIGLYVYRAHLLAAYASLPISPLEQWEKLEQLRFLHQGIRIQVAFTSTLPPHGVDTPDDLRKLNARLASHSSR